MENVGSVEEQLGLGPHVGESDDQSVETGITLFADTLLKYLDKRTERGKTNYKWDGNPDELKDFITLILKRDGQWKPKKAIGGKQMYIFTDGSGHLTLNFWQSSKTVSIQGNEKNIEKVQERQIENLFQDMKPTLVKSEINTRDSESRTEQNEDDAVTKTSAISKSRERKIQLPNRLHILSQIYSKLKQKFKTMAIS